MGTLMATKRPAWFGTVLRLAVGAFLMWYGIKKLQHSEWLVPGIFVAIAIPLVLTLGLYTFESLSKRTSVLSTSQLFIWNRVYFIGVLVAVSLWRGPGCGGRIVHRFYRAVNAARSPIPIWGMRGHDNPKPHLTPQLRCVLSLVFPDRSLRAVVQ